MKFISKTVRQSINKAWLKQPIEREKFDLFKESLELHFEKVAAAREEGESEEHFKNFLKPLFKSIGFENYYINTRGRYDLVIHNGSRPKESVGVLIEVKRPSNRAEMITRDQINRKAMHEAVHYYLQERIEHKNTDLKHVIITNLDEWFIFDAQEFERLFYRPSRLRRTWKEWKADRKVSSTSDFMYREISRFIEEQPGPIHGVWLPLTAARKFLKGAEQSDYEKKLIPVFKLFTPVHLLKEPFANDSNSLNREFYRELLYILGLEEKKVANVRLIRRADPENRKPGSLIENTIRILDSEDHLQGVQEPLVQYGANRKEQLFHLALELCITWMNRILFLKLLEAQLYRYHRQDPGFRFLNYRFIDSFDELNKLFFQVLARKRDERPEGINNKYGHIPYLNSSLFDVSPLERQTTRISGLDDQSDMPVYSRSVLYKERGNSLNTLDYLFRFLDAYDFSAEGGEEIREESKSLINASVLGLIFEKINGYKDGSFFTPGFVTEYMARETLEKAVTDAFNRRFGWDCTHFDDLYNYIHRERIPLDEANRVINELKICDPAVGSGHFLVSSLNELIAIKSRLNILCDRDGKILSHLEVSVENDELTVSIDDGEDVSLFEYEVSHTWVGRRLATRRVQPRLERVQMALFHEIRHLIENCLFGVDINPNSVKICRLRLWIELLKRAYYTPESNRLDLEVLPNIDINIKRGNSLISRFDLESDLSVVFRKSGYSLEEYKSAVREYKKSGEREEKQRLQNLIDRIKEVYRTTLYNNRPINVKLSRERGKLEVMTGDDLFGEMKFTAKEISRQKEKVRRLEKQKAEEEDDRFFNGSFEWRFEFPELLDEEGNFTGFDVILGNPPYIRQEELTEFKPYFQKRYRVYQGTADIYSYFIELGMELLRPGGYFHYIVANKWMRANYGKELRSWLQSSLQIEAIYDFGDLPVFEEATTYPCLLQLRKEPPSGIFHAANIDTLQFDRLDDYLTANRFEVEQSALSVDGWALIDRKSQALLEKLRSKGVPLGEYVEGKIFYGIKTGLNEAFVIDAEMRERLIREDPKSEELIKPFLRGRDIKRYQQPVAEQFLILIPNGWTDEKTAHPDKWNWFLEAYPAIAKHLSNFEEKARKRYDKGKYWWELRSCDYYEEFEKPKIIYPNICPRPEFTFDNFSQYTNQKCFIISLDDKALLGILNSKVMFFFFKNVLPKLRGDYFEPSYVFIKDFPIPSLTESGRKQITDLVENVLDKRTVSNYDNSIIEEEIDQIVYNLYDLTEEEIALIESHFEDEQYAPSDELVAG